MLEVELLLSIIIADPDSVVDEIIPDVLSELVELKLLLFCSWLLDERLELVKELKEFILFEKLEIDCGMELIERLELDI